MTIIMVKKIRESTFRSQFIYNDLCRKSKFNVVFNFIYLGQGQNVVRTGVPQQILQFPFQQTIPVQIPIATANGQTIIQTVHIPIQTLGTAMSNGGLMQGGQIQIIQPQMTQVSKCG